MPPTPCDCNLPMLPTIVVGRGQFGPDPAGVGLEYTWRFLRASARRLSAAASRLQRVQRARVDPPAPIPVAVRAILIVGIDCNDERPRTGLLLIVVAPANPALMIAVNAGRTFRAARAFLDAIVLTEAVVLPARYEA